MSIPQRRRPITFKRLDEVADEQDASPSPDRVRSRPTPNRIEADCGICGATVWCDKDTLLPARHSINHSHNSRHWTVCPGGEPAPYYPCLTGRVSPTNPTCPGCGQRFSDRDTTRYPQVWEHEQQARQLIREWDDSRRGVLPRHADTKH